MGLGFRAVRVHGLWNLWCLRFRGFRICKICDLGGLMKGLVLSETLMPD